MLKLQVNRGGVQNFTPDETSAVVSTLTIDGFSYSVTGSGILSDDIDTWIATHAETISERHGIYAVSATTTINLNHVDAARTISVSGGTSALGGRSEIASAGIVPVDGSVAVVSGATVVVAVKDVAAAYDVATFTFATASEAARGLAELDQLVVEADSLQDSLRTMKVPSVVTFA